VNLDGVDDYVDVGNGDFDLTSELTIAFWVYATGTGTGYQTIVARGRYAYPFRVDLSKDTHRVRTFVRTVNGAYSLNSARSLNPDSWRHFALTYRDGERVIYVDGSPDISDSPTGDLSAPEAVTTIGASGTGDCFLGRVDDVRIYNRALGPDEIQSLFNSAEASAAQTQQHPVDGPDTPEPTPRLTPTPAPGATPAWIATPMPTTPPAPIRTMIESFYLLVLGRSPESEAVDAWRRGYFDHAVNLDVDVRFVAREMGRLFLLSEEYASRDRTDAEFIADCYRAFLSREPNSNELEDWLGGVWNRAEVMTVFAESREFAARIDAMYPGRTGNNTRNFVATMYVGLLDRLVDKDGLRYAAAVFDASAREGGPEGCREQAKRMAREVVASEEFLSKEPGAREYVVHFYRAFLGRFPNDLESGHWIGELASGRLSVEDLIALFAEAPEFSQRLQRHFANP
jgi:hypothetical protein